MVMYILLIAMWLWPWLLGGRIMLCYGFTEHECRRHHWSVCEFLWWAPVGHEAQAAILPVMLLQAELVSFSGHLDAYAPVRQSVTTFVFVINCNSIYLRHNFPWLSYSFAQMFNTNLKAKMPLSTAFLTNIIVAWCRCYPRSFNFRSSALTTPLLSCCFCRPKHMFVYNMDLIDDILMKSQ